MAYSMADLSAGLMAASMARWSVVQRVATTVEMLAGLLADLLAACSAGGKAVLMVYLTAANLVDSWAER